MPHHLQYMPVSDMDKWVVFHGGAVYQSFYMFEKRRRKFSEYIYYVHGVRRKYYVHYVCAATALLCDKI